MNWNQLLHTKNTKKILVYGDVIHDHYIYGTASRISPEAPVPIMEHKSEEDKLGGAANVLQNLFSLETNCDLVTVLGDDSSARYIMKTIDQRLKYVVFEKNRKTPKKTRVVADKQQVIRIDNESTASIDEETQKSILNFFKTHIANYKVLVLSDYGKGTFANLKESFLQQIITLANDNQVITLIDPHNGSFESNFLAYKHATCIKANKKQAEKITGIKITDDASLEKAASLITELFDLRYVIITLSADGLYLKENHKAGVKYPGMGEEVYDVTGAGDSVIAALAYSMTITDDLDLCCKIANAAGNVKVKHSGTYAVTRNDIAEFLDEPSKIVNRETLVNILHNKNDKTLVFTNGCFDIIHPGHVELLKFCKQNGDIVVVGLNSDQSIKRLKGESRPVINQSDRANVLSAFEYVDYVCIFDEDTPKELINTIKPDVHVKGSDHTNETDGVPKTLFFQRFGGYSTTKLIS